MSVCGWRRQTGRRVLRGLGMVTAIPGRESSSPGGRDGSAHQTCKNTKVTLSQLADLEAPHQTQ